ncbi:hypothetical protein QTO34_017284 [Cnephaeus nilssonii]|uniref:Uncharacterized protein n=1 Tax=Cnephaeus nilssonii TaxID=3371016 RepID=A0AA40I1N5_CNENI|nr:hypothetical protein QTO34_017284 [Eptesicus nilssonii]
MAQTLSSSRRWRRELSVLLAQLATPSPAPRASWPIVGIAKIVNQSLERLCESDQNLEKRLYKREAKGQLNQLVVRYTPKVLEEMEARFEKLRTARRRQQQQLLIQQQQQQQQQQAQQNHIFLGIFSFTFTSFFLLCILKFFLGTFFLFLSFLFLSLFLLLFLLFSFSFRRGFILSFLGFRSLSGLLHLDLLLLDVAGVLRREGLLQLLSQRFVHAPACFNLQGLGLEQSLARTTMVKRLLYHSSAFCMFLAASFSYWVRMSLSITERSDLENTSISMEI